MNQSPPNPYEPPRSTGGKQHARDATVRITRTTSYADRLRAYHVVIDGEKRHKVKAGETVDVPVATSHHQVSVAVDWCGSPTIDFEIKKGQVVDFECGSNLLGLRIFLAIFYVFFARNNYLTLKRSG